MIARHRARFKRSQIRAALVHGNCLGLAVLFNRLLEVVASSGLIMIGAQQEIHRVARLVDGTIQVFPLAFDLDVGLINAPALADRPFALAECFFKHRQQLDNPPVHARMILNRCPARPSFFEVTQVQ